MGLELYSNTRMPRGVTNASGRQTMGNFGAPDPTWARVIALEYINNNDATALTENGGATVAIVAGVGGQATLTSGTTANTLGAAATAQAVFQVPTTTNGLGRMFYKWSGTLDSLLGTVQLGFVGSAASAPQGIYISSTVTTGALQLVVYNGTTTKTFPFPSNCTIVAGTQLELGIEVDYMGNVGCFYNPTTGNPQNGTYGVNGVVSNGPVVVAQNEFNGALTGLPLPTGALYASMGVIPTTAAARTLTNNFFVAAQQFGSY
jgi:hypothetical protein